MLRRDEHKSSVRPPAVAGLFYPANANELRREVEASIDAASLADASLRGRTPKAIVVPHAGYVYSGPVAGHAYRWVQEAAMPIRHVVLIGPSHRVYVPGLAVPSVAAFATPLGDVPIDVEARERLLGRGLVQVSDAAHAHEHSLEVQLPFLQAVLREPFDILPVVFGAATTAQVAQLLDAVWDEADTLVVVSSDLSHYLPWVEATRIDGETSRGIVERRGDLSDEQACGARGINGLLEVLRERGLQIQLLDQRNSGDTAGDHSRVVGYASYAVAA